MANKRLVSNDGTVAKATKGTVIAGDSSTALDAGWYVADTVLGTGSGLPDGIEAGLFFYAKAASVTPATGDSVLPITFEELCDITTASIDYTRGEIETTTLCDDIKVYRSGKVDASGSIEGITTIGITDQDGGFIQKFIKSVRQTAVDEVEVSSVDDDPIFIQLKVNKESTDDEDVAFFFFPATILGYSAGVTTGDDAQTFTSNFRITSDDDIQTQFFELATGIL